MAGWGISKRSVTATPTVVMNDLNTRERWICSADVDVDWPGHSNQFT